MPFHRFLLPVLCTVMHITSSFFHLLVVILCILWIVYLSSSLSLLKFFFLHSFLYFSIFVILFLEFRRGSCVRCFILVSFILLLFVKLLPRSYAMRFSLWYVIPVWVLWMILDVVALALAIMHSMLLHQRNGTNQQCCQMLKPFFSLNNSLRLTISHWLADVWIYDSSTG